MSDYRIMVGDALAQLATLPDESVQCCVTSPPYYGLRDYGVAGQIGLDATPDEYVARLVAVFREVRRVLADDGTLWLNLGDSYAAGKAGRTDHGSGSPSSRLGPQGDGLPGGTQPGPVVLRSAPPGTKPKDLLGVPWMAAFALRADGWWLREEVIWAKTAPMPESVRDRCTRAHEQVFRLTKSARYYADMGALREPPSRAFHEDRRPGLTTSRYGEDSGRNDGGTHRGLAGFGVDDAGRNMRSVWMLGPEPFPDAHFAVMPSELARRCVLSASRPGDTVLDPFAGAGTTGVVCVERGRSFVGIELNPEYAQLAERRIGKVTPPLGVAVA